MGGQSLFSQLGPAPLLHIELHLEAGNVDFSMWNVTNIYCA